MHNLMQFLTRSRLYGRLLRPFYYMGASAGHALIGTRDRFAWRTRVRFTTRFVPKIVLMDDRRPLKSFYHKGTSACHAPIGTRDRVACTTYHTFRAKNRFDGRCTAAEISLPQGHLRLSHPDRHTQPRRLADACAIYPTAVSEIV